VADYADGSVRTIRGGAVVATTSGGAAPDGIAVDPTTHVVYLASSGSNDVAALDPASGSVLWRRPVGGQPQGVAVDPVTHHVLAAVLSPATIVELDGGSGAVVASRASANGQPVAVAFDVRTATAYVLGVNAAAQAGFLTAYDGATLAVAGSTAVGSDPAAVDVDWRTNLVFATSTSDGVVTSYAGVPGTTTPLPQAIAFTAPATAAAGTTATLSATGGDSGNPVVFSVDASSGPGVCSVSGSTLTFAAGGSCVVDANQAGDATYAAAPQVQRTIAVTAADSTPPVLTVPGRTTVDATGPSGAVVTFAATATDDTDASPAVLCTPASGSRFAVGDTTVTCTATDAAGNVAKKTFVVHVRSAKEQLDAALALTAKLLAQRGHAALAPVLVELGAARLAGRGKPACLALALAEKSLKGASGRVLDADDRQELLDDVARIEDVLGC
jgi:DNA-binding beta-propeller fold protein YncE